MAQPFRLDRLDLIHVQVQLRRFRRNVLGDLAELGSAAADDGARAGTLGRAIVFTQAALVVEFRAAEVKGRDVLQRDVLDSGRASAPGHSGAQFLFLLAQPIAEPGHVAITMQRIAQNVPERGKQITKEGIGWQKDYNGNLCSILTKYLQWCQGSQVVKRSWGDARDFVLEQGSTWQKRNRLKHWSTHRKVSCRQDIITKCAGWWVR